MNASPRDKVTASHLHRTAYLYVRQSTLQQVLENTESTQRQYDLRQRAVALGWSQDQVVVIDSDQGQSGASAADREGFQRLVTEVGLGRAGIVMGLEVSRLARNSADWHRLLELCALSSTLILDEDGLYDPAHFNDRLLLGLKGTMSEAELHVLRARLTGGLLNKARRGALEIRLPIGFVHDAAGHAVLDPDAQVRESVETFFRTFLRTGSASATARAFRDRKLRFPVRSPHGPRQGEILWEDLLPSRARDLLRNPCYAGAYAFGRTRQRKNALGKRGTKALPRPEWTVLIPDAHAGYITWQEYEANQQRLMDNTVKHGEGRHASPPREGSALLQGIVLCGACGRRMHTYYHRRGGDSVPSYVCDGTSRQGFGTSCQRMASNGIDQAIGALLVELVSPVAIDVSLAVQRELQARFEEADRLRQAQVQRARYEAELARRRYMQVDPDNRLVADTLEADWNAKLRAVGGAQEEYERQREADRVPLDEARQQQVRALASDFPRLWKAPTTSCRERKRMLRLLVEDATLLRGEEITVHLRFRGGKLQTLTLPLSPSLRLPWWTSGEIVEEIDRLVEDHPLGEVATILNEQGRRTGTGLAFTSILVRNVCRKYKLRSRSQRLRHAGLLTTLEMARRLKVGTTTIHRWRNQGLLQCHVIETTGRFMYPPPGPNAPIKRGGRRARASAASHANGAARIEEV